jgi:hypothetical protein
VGPFVEGTVLASGRLAFGFSGLRGTKDLLAVPVIAIAAPTSSTASRRLSSFPNGKYADVTSALGLLAATR